MSPFTTADHVIMGTIETGLRPDPWQMKWMAAAYADYDAKLDVLTRRPDLADLPAVGVLLARSLREGA